MEIGTVLSVTDNLVFALKQSKLREDLSILGYKSQLDDLQRTVSTIRAVLRVAETKQEFSQQEQYLIEKVKDVVFEAEDLFDEFFTLAELKQLPKADSWLFEKVRDFFPSSEIPRSRGYRMSRRVKDIKKKFDAIVQDKQFRSSFQIDPERSLIRSLPRKITTIIWDKVVCNKWLYRLLNVILEICQVALSEVNDHQKISDFLFYKLIFIISCICLAISFGEFIAEVKRSRVEFQRRGICCGLYYPGINGRLFGSVLLYSSFISSAIQFFINLAILSSKKRFFGADTTALVLAIVSFFSPIMHPPQQETTKKVRPEV